MFISSILSWAFFKKCLYPEAFTTAYGLIYILHAVSLYHGPLVRMHTIHESCIMEAAISLLFRICASLFRCRGKKKRLCRGVGDQEKVTSRRMALLPHPCIKYIHVFYTQSKTFTFSPDFSTTLMLHPASSPLTLFIVFLTLNQDLIYFLFSTKKRVNGLNIE